MAVTDAVNRAAAGSEAPSDQTQIACKFVTKLPAKYRVPGDPVAVPATITRYGLSQVVNHMLELDPSRPFDFLVGQELIRSSLESVLLAHKISTEAVLEVEYALAVIPPSLNKDLPHDDW